MDDSEEPKRPRTHSVIHCAAAETRAPVITKQNKRMIKWAPCTGRSQGPPVNTTGREEKKNCWAHYMLEPETLIGLITIWKWEQIKESSHTRKYKTCAHTGHMTFATGSFASGSNEPACLFPTSLVLIFFFFFQPNKDSSDHSRIQTRRSWAQKEKEKKNQWLHSCGR